MWTGLQDEVLVLLAAQRFYIEHSSDSKFEKLDHFVRNWLSEEMLQKHEPAYYVEKVTAKLQALVYDLLPSTTAVLSYAIGSRKLSANEQFFCWYSNSSKFVTNDSDYIRRLFYN